VLTVVAVLAAVVAIASGAIMLATSKTTTLWIVLIAAELAVVALAGFTRAVLRTALRASRLGTREEDDAVRHER
jgi:hypothetical protein